jgi:hypothetical protein
MARPFFNLPRWMSEYEREVEFLRQCILYEESSGRQELEEEIAYIQRNTRSVQRMAWLMTALTALAIAGLGCPAILLKSFPYNTPRFIVNLVCALGMGSLVSLLLCVCLGMVYRNRLCRQKEACRQLVTKLLESRLGKPLTEPLRSMPDTRLGDRDSETAQVATEANGSLLRVESPTSG